MLGDEGNEEDVSETEYGIILFNVESGLVTSIPLLILKDIYFFRYNLYFQNKDICMSKLQNPDL